MLSKSLTTLDEVEYIKVGMHFIWVLKHTMEVEITPKGMKIILKQLNVLTFSEVEN